MIDFLESNWRKMFSCENGNSQLLFLNPCLQPAWTSFERVTNMINLKMKCNFRQSKNSFMLCQSDTLIFSRIYFWYFSCHRTTVRVWEVQILIRLFHDLKIVVTNTITMIWSIIIYPYNGLYFVMVGMQGGKSQGRVKKI